MGGYAGRLVRWAKEKAHIVVGIVKRDPAAKGDERPILMSDRRDAGVMRIPDAGLSRIEALDEGTAGPLPAILIWGVIVGIVVWVLAGWKFLEIVGLVR